MYKIELTKEELIFLRLNLHTKDEKEKELVDNLYTKICNAKLHIPSNSKRLATQKATKVRTDKAKEKIQNAINLLQLENKNITHYSIATTSGVSFNTVKKHIPDIDIIGKI